MSQLSTNKIIPATSTTVTLGDLSDTFQVPSGVTLNVASGATISNSGTATGFGGTTAGSVTATTSGTSVTFGSIPAGTKRIDIIFNEVSPDGGVDFRVRIGDSGGLETSGYVGKSSRTEGSAHGVSSATDCYIIQMGQAGSTQSGVMSLYLVDASNNDWVNSHSFGKTGTNAGVTGGGSKSLSAELTQVQFYIASGALDAGEINIHYWQ